MSDLPPSGVSSPSIFEGMRQRPAPVRAQELLSPAAGRDAVTPRVDRRGSLDRSPTDAKTKTWGRVRVSLPRRVCHLITLCLC